MMNARSLAFEDFSMGQVFKNPAGRVVREDDVSRFGELSGDMNRLHFDEAFAAKTPFQGRIAHGLLGLSLASGLLHDLGILRETTLAFRHLEWKFKAPVRPGDALSLELEVARTRSAPGALKGSPSGALKGSPSGGGMVVFNARLKNQRDETVQEGAWSLLVRKRDS